MTLSGVHSFIEVLEKEGELIRVKQFVNPELEITEITDRFSKQSDGGKAILFENTGTGFPVLINALGSEKRVALAFGRNSIFDLENEIEKLFSELMQPKDTLWDKLRMLPRLKEVSAWMPKKLTGKGRCQEIVMESPDLGKLPVLKCWPADGGPFVTLPGVHTVDPETNIPNLGMYRMQVFDKDLTGMHWHKHKTGASHFEKYKKLGKKMPVSVALGGDLIYTYAATAPMPENVDEYLLAGFLRKKPVKLVKCLTNDLFVPEDSDFVIEGFVDPAEELIREGPFGDHTGFYSLADWYPKFHVTCITHRHDAVYPATIVGVPPMEDACIGLATERIFLTPIRMTMVPEMKDMTLPVAGVAHNFAVVSIEKNYPGQAVKVMNSLWGAGQMMFNKVLVVVDCEVNIHEKSALAKAFNENFDPGYSLHFSKGPMDVLDHSSQKFAFGSKLGIDLTKPFTEEFAGKKEDITKTQFDINLLNEIREIASGKLLTDDFSLPVLLLSVKKDDRFSKAKLENKLQHLPGIEKLKGVVIFNEEADLNDTFTLLWLLGGNLDPGRDISVSGDEKEGQFILVDATFKTGQHDDFGRQWPNIVTMDDAVISAIDEKWNELGLGAFIESPSLRFKPLVKGDGAVRK
ncbi:MAG: menaquinone biosynthesis decarboxylase [Prolixibacteraceae bacterium]|nr:menaquinone biosynthesis decarboxylase [Prolixibacteraceae bacterium]